MDPDTAVDLPAPELTSEDVASAAKDAWRVVGQQADVVPWTSLARTLGLTRHLSETEPGAAGAGPAMTAAVIVRTENLVECVIQSTDDFSAAARGFTAILEKGWGVNAIVPIGCMGTAHEAWRGLRIQMQGWWRASDRLPRFTAPELP
jgi:phage tail protein X